MIKKVHKKCMMKGCACRSSYHISLSREIGNSIIICKSCAKKALEMIEDYEKGQDNIFDVPTEIENSAEKVIDENATPTEEMQGVQVWECERCGKSFGSERGLASHMRVHDKE